MRDGRAALAVLLALSLLANLGLSIALASVERMTVLVPAVTGPAWEVGGGRAGSRYLEDMGRTVAVTLLTLTPENAEHAREAAARLAHASARGAIGAWVAAEAGRMARRDLSTAFYPGRIEADPGTLDRRGERGARDLGGARAGISREETLPAVLPRGRGPDRAASFRGTGGEEMNAIDEEYPQKPGCPADPSQRFSWRRSSSGRRLRRLRCRF